MKYNTNRKMMPLPEYGRNIQLMVDHTLQINDREQRTIAANNIINLMAQQNYQMRNQPEFMQKLWDHLHIMADYKLEVDSEYTKPEKPFPGLQRKRKINYPNNKPKYRFYGKSLELAIAKAADMPDGEDRDRVIQSLLSFMIISYKTWNFEKVSDEVIIKHMYELSNGKIKVDQVPDISYIPEKTVLRKFKNNKKKKKRKNNFDRKY